MSAIDTALSAIDRVAEEGDLAPERRSDASSSTRWPIRSLLPDGKRIYPPRLHGQPIDELACALLDMEQPGRVDVPAPHRPAGLGQEPDRPRDRLPAVARPRPDVEDRHGAPFYGFVEISRRPVQRRVPVPPRVRPRRRGRRHRPARRLGVRAGDARGLGGDDRRGQHDPRRRAAERQRRARRPPVPLPPGDRRDGDRATGVRVPARLQPGPGRRAPTSRTPGTRGSRRRSRSRATGRRSPSSARRGRWWPRRWRSTASGSPARTG